MKQQSEEVRDLFRQIVTTIWDRAKDDADFRKRLLADPEGTLNDEGLDEIHDLVTRIKTADKASLEAGIQSRQKTPTC